jgi:mono/diheme cytochrome c family protein
VEALVIFLKSRRGVNFAETSLDRYKAHVANVAVVIPPGTAGEKAGQQLLGDRACTACHKLGDRDGGIAPDLSYEGLIRDEQWLGDHFKNPRSRMPDSIMPAFRFPADDFQRLTAYLESLKTPPPPRRMPRPPSPTCARAATARRATATAKWPGTSTPRRAISPSRASWLPSRAPASSLHRGRRGRNVHAAMEANPEGRADQRRAGLRDAEFRQGAVQGAQGAQYAGEEPGGEQRGFHRRGEQIFELRCTGCHGRKADGKGPNSLDIFPHPRNFRNHWFVESVPDRRLFESIEYGVQGTAMPSWIDMLSTNEVGDVINFIRSLQMPAK